MKVACATLIQPCTYALWYCDYLASHSWHCWPNTALLFSKRSPHIIFKSGMGRVFRASADVQTLLLQWHIAVRANHFSKSTGGEGWLLPCSHPRNRVLKCVEKVSDPAAWWSSLIKRLSRSPSTEHRQDIEVCEPIKFISTERTSWEHASSQNTHPHPERLISLLND